MRRTTIPLAIIIIMFGLWSYTAHRMRVHKPDPLPAFAPAQFFSEGRAMQHTEMLATNFTERQIGTEGARAAAEYLYNTAYAFRQYAHAHRADLEVQVFLMDNMSGAFPCSFSGVEFTSVYHDAINVVMSIAPKNSTHIPGVLINAHFDNSQGTPGASDCASCVGVSMEIARTMVYDAAYDLAAPVVFLWNGAEETLFQGAHAFMLHKGKYPLPELGAFINLESTGPGGYETLIQHNGGWTAEAFARVAPYARGSVWSQDQLDLHLIPGTTDYVIFSQHMPGADIAFIDDASAYHTMQDKVERIQPGWLQSMGVNTLALAQEFTNVLAANHTGAPTGYTNMEASKVIFSDFWGFKMVTLSQSFVENLRMVPLLVAVALPLLQGSVSKQNQYSAVANCFGRNVVSLASALLLGAVLMGACRAQLSGVPMAWFGNPWLICLTYIPAGLAGCMLPYMGQTAPSYSAYTGGYSLLAGLLAYAAASAGMGGSTFFALAAAGSCFLQLLDNKGSFNSYRSLALAMVFNGIPVAFSVASLGFGVRHVLQKINFVGHAPGAFTLIAQDLGIGALLILPMYLHVALMLPFFAYNMSRKVKVATLCMLLATSLTVGAYVSTSRSPYSVDHPKRVWVQHMHENVHGVDSDRFVFGSWDNIKSSVAFGPVQQAMLGDELPVNNGREWLSVPFLRDHFLTETYTAPPVPSPYNITDLMKVTAQEYTGEHVRMHYTLQPPEGCFSAAVVFKLDAAVADIAWWSITESAPVAVAGQDGQTEYPMWITGLQQVTQYDFTLEIDLKNFNVNSTVGASYMAQLGFVELSMSRTIPEHSPALGGVVDRLPEWASAVHFETFQTVMPVVASKFTAGAVY